MASATATGLIVRGLQKSENADGSYGEWRPQVVINRCNREVLLERDSNRTRRIQDTWVPPTLVFRDWCTTDIQGWGKHRYAFREGG